MGSTANTYLIAAGSIVAGAIGMAVARLDLKEVGIVTMGAGIAVLVAAAASFARKRWYRVTPRRALTVTETGGARTWAAVVGQSTVRSEDVAGTPLL
jgi:hypothetical protein